MSLRTAGNLGDSGGVCRQLRVSFCFAYFNFAHQKKVSRHRRNSCKNLTLELKKEISLRV
ncbi:MAG: hypothetical protein OFPII_39690 [Osedax symbiont Rs1]|nr:MAG: hypothetical protein OFPII_39690 [Osedax symbiont Rs1]